MLGSGNLLHPLQVSVRLLPLYPLHPCRRPFALD